VPTGGVAGTPSLSHLTVAPPTRLLTRLARPVGVAACVSWAAWVVDGSLLKVTAVPLNRSLYSLSRNVAGVPPAAVKYSGLVRM
jgi:hypothetical protein